MKRREIVYVIYTQSVVRTDSNMCRKELMVHWSTPNSLVRSYPQPCTNSKLEGESEVVALIIPECGCPKEGYFLSRSSRNSPETRWRLSWITYPCANRNIILMFLLRHVLLCIANALELLQSWWIVFVTFDDVIYIESYNKGLVGKTHWEIL